MGITTLSSLAFMFLSGEACPDIINEAISNVIPGIALELLLFFLPLYLFFNFLVSRVIRPVFSEDVAGKVILITGASSGIGEYLAYEYAKRGACLALVARREDRLFDVATTASLMGCGDVITICADVSKVEDCKRFVDGTVNDYGRLDHLVNNAGIAPVSMFENIPDVTKYVQAMASKAAVISFYETVRVEIGGEVGITIVTPGLVDSEMTHGKFLTREGRLEVDPEMRDVQISLAPLMPVEEFAKAIVNSACRRDNYATQPPWMRSLYYWRAFWPEILEWCNRVLLVPAPGKPDNDTLSKKIYDLFPDIEDYLYPGSLSIPS